MIPSTRSFEIVLANADRAYYRLQAQP
jgi:hypothetical protein